MALRYQDVHTYHPEQGKRYFPCGYFDKHPELRDWAEVSVKSQKPFEELASEALDLIADSTKRGYLSEDVADMLVRQVCVQALERQLTFYVRHYLTPLWRIPIPTLDPSTMSRLYAPFQHSRKVPMKARAATNVE